SKYRTRVETIRRPCAMSSGEAARRYAICGKTIFLAGGKCRQKPTDVWGTLHTREKILWHCPYDINHPGQAFKVRSITRTRSGEGYEPEKGGGGPDRAPVSSIGRRGWMGCKTQLSGSRLADCGL